MKAANIRFFSPTENSNQQIKPHKVTKSPNVILIDYVSTAGKLVLPAKTVA